MTVIADLALIVVCALFVVIVAALVNAVLEMYRK